MAIEHNEHNACHPKFKVGVSNSKKFRQPTNHRRNSYAAWSRTIQFFAGDSEPDASKIHQTF